MDRFEALEQIANGIQAAGRIKKLFRENTRGGDEAAIMPSSVSTLNEVLEVIAEYSPGFRRQAINDTVIKSNMLSDTYRSLKTNFSNAREGKLDRESVLKTLSAIRPMVSERQKLLIDKVLKIYEILNN